jgi:hypothetical protein
MRRGLLESLAGQKTVVLNLHAMDLVDAQNDGLPSELTARQPELRIPMVDRRSILESVLLRLAIGREIITAGQLARALLAPG